MFVNAYYTQKRVTKWLFFVYIYSLYYRNFGFPL